MEQKIPSQFARYSASDFELPAAAAPAQVTERDFEVRPSAPPPADVQQHERDLYEGPLARELGADPRMVLRKLKYSLPGLEVPREVADYPEMLYALVVLAAVFLVSLLSRSQLHAFIPTMFGALIYGSVLFKLLTNLLLQGEKSIDLYAMMSAICYSLTPILAAWLVFSVVRVSYATYLLVSLPVCAAAAFVLQKHVAAVLPSRDVQLLIAFPAVLYSVFWLLMGRGLAK